MIGARAFAGAWAGFKASPAYPATAADLRTVEIAGVQLPVRATVAVTVITFALLFDYSHTFVPEALIALGRAPDTMLAIAIAIARVVSFGVVPLVVVLFVFRDRPSRYGLTLGDWRWGSALTSPVAW